MTKKVIQLILASNSPRRKQLLKQTGLNFKSINTRFDEQYSTHLKHVEIVEYIVYQKANSLLDLSTDQNLIIVTDTIVWNGYNCLGKPKNEKQATSMLEQLSNQSHHVITGVGFLLNKKFEFLHQSTEVKFKKLEKDEILYYIQNYSPFDKSGSYGIQEWIGLIGIDWIKGSYTNVMGLPLSHVHEKLKGYAITYNFG